MLNYVYYCTDNQILTAIKPSIDFSLEKKYIGRKIIPEKYYELFDQNGYSIENEEYEFNGITATIIPTIDENNCITEIECYKAQDFSTWHGKADSDERGFNKKDIKHFSKILDSVTVDPVEGQYEQFIRSFSKGEALPGGYTVSSANTQGITLISEDGETKRLSRTKLRQALLISHKFIDVLYCVDTLKESPQYFEDADIPLYLAVFSKIDRTTYQDYQDLLKEAESRALFRDIEVGYSALINAVRDNDFSKISSQSKYAPFVVMDRDIYPDPPLHIAVKRNDITVARLLLESGAYSTEERIDYEKHICVSPLLLAVEQQNYEMIKLLCDYHGAEINQSYGYSNFLTDTYALIGEKHDMKALKIILPFAAHSKHKTVFDPSVFTKLSSRDIEALSRIENAKIQWPAPIIAKAYEKDKDKCIRMLHQGCDLNVLDLFIDTEDYDMFTLALSNHDYVEPRPSYRKIYERGGKWYEAIIKTAASIDRQRQIKNNLDSYLGNLIRKGAYKEFKATVERLGLDFPGYSLQGLSWSSDEAVPEDGLIEFLQYVFENWDYKENVDISCSSSLDYSFDSFAKAVFRFGSLEMANSLLRKYSNRIIQVDGLFDKAFEIAVEQRTDDIFISLLAKKIAYEIPRPYSVGQKKICDLFLDIVNRYSKAEKKTRIADCTEKAIDCASRWIAALRGFLSIMPIEEVSQFLDKCGYYRYIGVKTLHEFFAGRNIENVEVLSLLQIEL